MIGGNSAYDYSLDKSDLFHLVRDFSEQRWHTPDEKPEEGRSIIARWPNGSVGAAYYLGKHLVLHHMPRSWFEKGMERFTNKDFGFLWTYDVPQPTETEFKLLDK